jgi:serine/threonine protein kinase
MIEIIEKMLEINPKKRITCTEILKHPYFKEIKAIIPPTVYQRF